MANAPKEGSAMVEGVVGVVSLVSLAAALAGASGIVWICATMAATVWREHSFTFYLSAEEEQSALSQAERDHLRAIEKEHRDRQSQGYVLILCGFLLLFATFIAWGLRPGAAWPFLAGDFAGVLTALISMLPVGPWSSSWPRAFRTLMVVAALFYAGSLLESRAPNAGRGLQVGTIAGVAIGQAIRALSKKKATVIPISESSTLAQRQS
jgi:hypothetical protein